MKLYSELAERENRFFLSLEISFPFVLVIALLAYLLNSINFEWQDRILFVVLVLCYIYYVVYLIYYGFNSTLLDDKSGAFSRDEIIKIISKEVHKSNQNVVLLNISNLQDISQRYGHKNGDKIVRNFILEFNKFFGENGFDRIKIGRYFGANFLFITDCKISQLEHLLKSFECQIVNRGINNIEVKMKFAVNKNLYDKNIENIINFLFLKLNQNDEYDKILRVNSDDDLICYAIDQGNFDIKIQHVKPLKSNFSPFYSASIKLISKELGNIVKNKVLAVALLNNYEIKYDLQILRFIAKNVGFDALDMPIMLEISPVTLRNVIFYKEIQNLIATKDINPEKIIFEIYEENACEDINRFNEIIVSFKNLGFSFALNKFGGNNAGVEYIKFLPIDFVILDIEFNKGFLDERIKTYYIHLAKMAENFGIKSVVRFVDKKGFYDDLNSSGLDYVQGFFIDKPKNIKLLKE